MSKYFVVKLEYIMTVLTDSEEDAIEFVVMEAKSASQTDFEIDVQEHEKND